MVSRWYRIIYAGLQIWPGLQFWPLHMLRACNTFIINDEIENAQYSYGYRAPADNDCLMHTGSRGQRLPNTMNTYPCTEVYVCFMILNDVSLCLKHSVYPSLTSQKQKFVFIPWPQSRPRPLYSVAVRVKVHGHKATLYIQEDVNIRERTTSRVIPSFILTARMCLPW